MKKTTIALSLVAALSTSSFGAKLSNDELQVQIEALKAQLALLEAKINEATKKPAELKLPEATEKRIEKIEKKVASNYTKINDVKAHDAGDNIKWDIDFRTQVDNIGYKLTNGTKLKNEAVMSNRLWLGMKYQADDNSLFYGTLSYNKLFGEDVSAVNNSQFDWVTNEAAGNDNSLNVKEAYWLYMNDSFMGNKDLPWTVSVGRRPSTDGLGINLRADQERKSALSHTVNVEFDGASAKFTLEKLTGITGMWLKFCAGRGLTNARLRFDQNGYDYAKSTTTSNTDMAGFIFVPYDNGQYSIHTNYAKAWNLIGYENGQNTFTDFGNLQLANLVLKVDGIGDGISDYLDNTVAFASFAMSKTDPGRSNAGMLGSHESQTGHSIWLGVNAPCPIDPEDSRIGVEWNKGSKYWRSFTYGEDTMVGSKVAARGTAWEIFRNQNLTKALSWTLRYTKIDYDYTGSNGFFGYYGAPVDIDSSPTAVKEAQNITANIRYRF
jgi:hypothetical protein